MARKSGNLAKGLGVAAIAGVVLYGLSKTAGAEVPGTDTGDDDDDDPPNDPPPKKGPGGKGKIFEDPSNPVTTFPADFNFGGNRIFILPDCSAVIEGNLFRHPIEAFDFFAIEPPEYGGYPGVSELEAVWSIHDENSVAGFIDFFLELDTPPPPAIEEWFYTRLDEILHVPTPSTQRALRIASELLRQASPLCADTDPNTWGIGLRAWFVDFVIWVADYIFFQHGDSIEDFDPAEE